MCVMCCVCVCACIEFAFACESVRVRVFVYFWCVSLFVVVVNDAFYFKKGIHLCACVQADLCGVFFSSSYSFTFSSSSSLSSFSNGDLCRCKCEGVYIRNEKRCV